MPNDLQQLIKTLKSSLIGVGAKLCRTVALQGRVWTPRFRLLYLHCLPGHRNWDAHGRCGWILQTDNARIVAEHRQYTLSFSNSTSMLLGNVVITVTQGWACQSWVVTVLSRLRLRLQAGELFLSGLELNSAGQWHPITYCSFPPL